MKQVGKLIGNQEGAVLPLVGLAMTTLILSAGFAIDYTRAAIVKERLQWAVDAAALAGSKASTNTTAAVNAEARRYFEANFPDNYMGVKGRPTLSTVGATKHFGDASVGYRFTTSAINVPSIMLGAVGWKGPNVSATAEVNTLPLTPLDVVFSLDVSGSMSLPNSGPCEFLNQDMGSYWKYADWCYNSDPSRLAEAKTAMRNLVNTLHVSSTRFGLVPWDSTVNGYGVFNNGLSHRNCEGRTVSRLADIHAFFGNSAGWAGYSECRELHPNAVRGSAPIRPMTYLTNNKTTILNAINSQNVEGNTDGGLGMLWAYRMWENHHHGGWRGWRAPAANRAIILLTDGRNTADYRSPSDRKRYEDFGPGSTANQEQWCRTAKNQGIFVYTIAYGINDTTQGNAEAKAMLNRCASDICNGGKCFFDARNASQLNSAMTTIGRTMMTVRLTR